ncbi:MAG: glycosyl transferase family 36 [Ignavibacteriae bacterium]|nr:glycosyl transferase family 36 [Ignavibacteriota bacterium]
MAKFETKYGFFSDDGSEYVIKNPKTPKPWVNVISNGSYGIVLSQTGGGFSWNEHSEFNRITRWHQDLIQDNWGKFFYLRNNKTGEIWSPTWNPVKADLDFYNCIHGIGYTKFVTEYKKVKIEILVFIPFNKNLEIWDFKIKNETEEDFDLSIINYFEWVLGSSNDHHREFHKQFLETEFNENFNGIIAKKRIWDIPLGDRGHWNIDYPYSAFFISNKKVSEFECDKESFLGNYGNLEKPKAVVSGKLSNTCGKFYDSIASLKIDLNIKPGNEENVSYYLGLAENEEDIAEIVNSFWDENQIKNALSNVKNKWSEILGSLEIETPDEAMNIFVNKWVRYQAISGRLWGRTAYYQQSGAFGFRDQLQDSLVFLPIDPKLTEKQIRLHARHQISDGTVLHWWHPISETGLETKMTDDLLWLPYILSHYIQETNDLKILDHLEPFYDDKEKKYSIYEHCLKAIYKVLSRLSPRGLTLIGAGDWNDGLSAVGLEMKGESIWLTEFLYDVIQRFLPYTIFKGDYEIYDKFTAAKDELKKSFNKYAWDGEWFYRGTKDSGEKIGSKECEDGKIYLNPQSWSVISDIAENDKKIKAMESVRKHLLRDNGALLLQPAYSKPDKYIGYLSRYAAGRRENGGVYSHAATWSIWAYALLYDSETAYDIFKKMCPIYSGMNPDKYVAEPYVMPGNIDGPDSPNYGMAGWTWYTGSASWYQKVIVDWILGIRASNEGLIIDPHIPKHWNEFKVKRNFRGTNYFITVFNSNNVNDGVKKIEIDGNIVNTSTIFVESKKEVKVNVYLG